MPTQKLAKFLPPAGQAPPDGILAMTRTGIACLASLTCMCMSVGIQEGPGFPRITYGVGRRRQAEWHTA